MNNEILDFILAAGVVMAALAVAVTCGIGLVVWQAGGKMDRRKDEKPHRFLQAWPGDTGAAG